MLLVVKHYQDKHSVEVSPNSTVKDLQNVLECVTHVPVSRQKLVMKGKLLKEENVPLSFYGIKEGSRIMLMGQGITAEDVARTLFSVKLKPASGTEVLLKQLSEIRKTMDSLLPTLIKWEEIKRGTQGSEDGVEDPESKNSSDLEESEAKMAMLCSEATTKVMLELDGLYSDVCAKEVVQERRALNKLLVSIGHRLDTVSGRAPSSNM